MSIERPIIIERREPPKNYSLSLEEFRRVAKEGVVVPVCRTIPSDFDTPVRMFDKLARKEKKTSNFSPSFLLESVTGGENVGRYSYICINPKGGIKVQANEISELRPDETISTQSGERIDPLKVIKEEVSKTVVRTSGLPTFTGGYVGYLGYEVAGAFENTFPKSKLDPLGIPEAMLFNFDNVIVFDHAHNELKIVGNINVGDLKDLDNQYRETTCKIDETVNRILAPETAETKSAESSVVVNRDIKSNFTDEEYRTAVRKVREYLIAGDAIQVVISQRFARQTNAAPFAIYRALRRGNPSPYMAYLDFGDFQIISASPELLLQVENRKITMHPIAGTRPRGKTDEEDAKLENELKTSEKQRAEHIMLVDLGRNDVGRVSAPGTVKVTKLMEVVRFSNVMHLASEVQGMLSDKYTPLDALRASFPAGTVSGAPKIRAMQIINEVEPEKRGAYAGAIGYIDYNGDFKMAITIRTIVFKDGVAYAQAGGGIVVDSDPEDERQETVDKANAAFRAIKLAEEEY